MCCCGAADMADSRASCCNDRDTICSGPMRIRERGVDDDRRNSRWQEHNSDSNTVNNKQYCCPQTGARIVGCTLVHETNSSGGDLPPHHDQVGIEFVSNGRLQHCWVHACARVVHEPQRNCNNVTLREIRCIFPWYSAHLFCVHGHLLPLHCRVGPEQSFEAHQIKTRTDSSDSANAFFRQSSPSRCHHLFGPCSGLPPYLPGVASKGDP